MGKRPRSPLANLGSEFARLSAKRDGAALHRLLRSVASNPDEFEDGPVGLPDAVASEVARAQWAGETEEGLAAWCEVLKRWCAQYASQPSAAWMTPPLLEIAASGRRRAAALDRRESGERHCRKLVEILRELFQGLHRDREKREGCLIVCCELLRLYFCLGQAAQCSFLLAAVSQSHGGKLDMHALPKALGVTFSFLWGKHCVMDGNVIEAEARLGWAFSRCPPESVANRRRILIYLVPCRLRLGRCPPRELLEDHGLGGLASIAAAVSAGDSRRFTLELELQEEELIRSGTYLVVEKLKLLVFRNLCRRVHDHVAASLRAAGKEDQRHKQDLRPFEQAFKWQDDCDVDETICILANLIYIGAVRGYLSDEHQKIIFSKDNPFPAASGWCGKA